MIRMARHKFLNRKNGPLIAVRLNIISRKTLGGLQTDLSGKVKFFWRTCARFICCRGSFWVWRWRRSWLSLIRRYISSVAVCLQEDK